MTHFCRATGYCRQSHRHLLAYYRAPSGQERRQAEQALQHRYPGCLPVNITVTTLEKHA